jgi:RNA polymerase sigma-70 factor (ECF subfamily)
MTKASVIPPSPANGVDPLAATSQDRGALRDHDWTSIVAQIHAGQDAGIEELYRILNRGLRYYLGRQLGQQDLEDRLHEVFLIVVSAIRKGQLREPERIMGFVRTVAQRRVAADIEKLTRNRKRENELSPDLNVVDQQSDPEQLAVMQQKVDLMKSVLLQMPERQREILVRFYRDEQTQEQICREMSLTETQFRLIKFRAKAAFGMRGQNALRKQAGSEMTKQQAARCA